MDDPVVVVDYGTGNLTTVHRKLMALGARTLISSSPDDVSIASRLVLPGVGHFGKAMDRLRELGLEDALNEAVLVRRVPILGICLGMQLMASASEEGAGVAGFGWISGTARKMSPADPLKFKVPHTGWNRIRVVKSGPLWEGLPPDPEFYFLHSFYVVPVNTEDIAASASHQEQFVCAVERDNIFGVQFHPEKSHQAGQCILDNFLKVPKSC